MSESESSPDRLRVHPEQRFAPPHQKIDLNEASAAIAAEGTAGGRGHHQKTLYRNGKATLALFAFDKGGRLAEHKTADTVTIHVLEGRLRVAVADEAHDLAAGQLVVLAPGVKHDVTAEEPSRMLLTVHLDPGPTGRE